MEGLNQMEETMQPDFPKVATESRGSLHVLVSVGSEMERRGMRTMLDPIPQVADVVTCSELQETIHLIHSDQFNVLIIAMAADLEGLKKIAAQAAQQHVRTVVLLRSLDEGATSSLGGLSVDGFLLEDELTERSLREALDSLTKGEMAMPGRLARRLLAQVRKLERAEAERPFLLTPREQQALVLLADGMSNKQIARRLGISEHGAKRHVANVLAKLNCPNRTLAVALALRHGLLCPDGTPGMPAL